MKQALIFFAVFVTISAAMHSCKEADYDGKTAIIRDSLLNVLPTWQSQRIVVSDDKTELLIVVGDASLYKAPIEEKNARANELAKMILRIYGKGNSLQKGTLIITADINNHSDAPADGIKIPMDLAAMKKEMGM